MGKKIKKSGKISFSTILGTFIIILFCGFFSTFIYQFITSNSADNTKRWCPTHNTYHDITDEIEDEVWCNNCQTWHAPNDESRTPSIK